MTTIHPFPLDSAGAYRPAHQRVTSATYSAHLGNQRADGKSFERARLRRGSL